MCLTFSPVGCPLLCCCCSSAPALLLHQMDKLTADAAELKAGYDKLAVDSSEQKAQLDKAAADAAEYKAGFDKAAADASEYKAGYDKLLVDTSEQKAQVGAIASLLATNAAGFASLAVAAVLAHQPDLKCCVCARLPPPQQCSAE